MDVYKYRWATDGTIKSIDGHFHFHLLAFIPYCQWDRHRRSLLGEGGTGPVYPCRVAQLLTYARRRLVGATKTASYSGRNYGNGAFSLCSHRTRMDRRQSARRFDDSTSRIPSQYS